MRHLLFLFTPLSVSCLCSLEFAESLCLNDSSCVGFGLYENQVQLHGCLAITPNNDWTLYSRNGSVFSLIPGNHNIDESKCSTHPNTGMQHSCAAPPPPAPLYTKVGAIDVGTYENTVFFWQDTLLNLENIACSYTEHAGIWDSSFGNHSYARIREFDTGKVLVNISETVSFGFITPFADYSTGILWLFGTPCDRCIGNGDATTVQAWWTTDPSLQKWSTAMAFNLGQHTYNVQVSKVGPPGGIPGFEVPAWDSSIKKASQAVGLPPHNFVMILEPFFFAINAGDGSDLSTGWVLLQGTKAPPAPSGGPMIVYSPYDFYYYILTGGKNVFLYRTLDFQTWVESSPSPFIAPSEEDALVSPYSGFPSASLIKGSPPNSHVGVAEPFPRRPFSPYWMGANWSAWSKNSNDGDMCCIHEGFGNRSIIIWGASTQGRPPSPPLDGTDASTNSVATISLPLHAMLASYFP